MAVAAYEIPGFSFTLPSNADYRTGAGQFRFVTVNSSGNAVASGLAADAIGVRQNKPNTGEAMTIVTSGISMVEAGEALAVGELVKSMANGLAGEADTAADYILGICLTPATASGQIVSVLLNVNHTKFA
jgi:predicted RecA/RadA family phage recombinase